MPTATAQALSAPAREFVSAGPLGHWIGGEQVPSADGRTFGTIDPATGEVICEVAHAGAADVDRAVAAARDAFEGPWKRMTPSKRAGMIYTLAELIKANLPSSPSSSRSTTASRSGTRKGEIAAGVNQLRYYAGWPTKIEGETIPGLRPRTCSATRARSRSASAGRSSRGTSRC